jgi:hypothetical protein
VAENVIAVWAVFNTKVAVPNDAGRGAPVAVVGFVGGFSCEVVKSANNIVSANAGLPRNPTNRPMKKTRSRNRRSRAMTILLE